MKIAIIDVGDSAAFQEPDVLGSDYAGQSYREAMPPEFVAEVDASDIVLGHFTPWGIGVMRGPEVEAVEFTYFTSWRRRTWPECPNSKRDDQG